MRTFRDAKAMAKALREGLRDRKVELSHSDCLELVARQFALKDWNTLIAQIERDGEAKALLLPEGWITSGSRESDYEMGIDAAEQGVAYIRYRYASGDRPAVSISDGFGTLMQSFSAEALRGKRVMLKAELRAWDVVGAVTLWLRIDGRQRELLRFDNMEQRAENGVLKGTTEWVPRSIVLDVPEEAQSVNFGFYLRGTGCAAARGFALVEVDEDVAATGSYRPDRTAPFNLDFSRQKRSAA